MNRFPDSLGLSGNIKALLLLLIFFGGILGIAYFVGDMFLIRKILLALVLPVGFLWLTLLTLTYLLIVNQRRVLGLVALLVTLVYSASGNGIIGGVFAEKLESPYFNFQVVQADPIDYLVILGGGTNFGRNEQPQLTDAGDRVMVALQMYKLGKAKKIICTGTISNNFAPGEVPSLGEQTRQLLLNCGVPDSDIEVVKGKTTEEEIQNLSKRFENNESKTLGIVSSAIHLPRVARMAKRHNLEFSPVPANFISGVRQFSLLSIIPSASSLKANSQVAKELIAQAIGL